VQEKYGRHTNIELLEELKYNLLGFKELDLIVTLKGKYNELSTYEEAVEKYGRETSDLDFEKARKDAHYHDVCNLQYTSGSTGDPKAAMLSHQ